jgi:MFS family permease
MAVIASVSGLNVAQPIMLAARFLSGVGAAMIMPVTLAVITSRPSRTRSVALVIVMAAVHPELA